MRRITKQVVGVIVAVVVLLLALGALPSLLRAGDPYYMTAEEVPEYDGPAINATGFSERAWPYTTAALESGRSEAYYRGPVGFKESFTHSPFDEIDGLAARDFEGTGANRTDYGAVENGTAYVTTDGTTYRLTVVQEGEES